MRMCQCSITLMRVSIGVDDRLPMGLPYPFRPVRCVPPYPPIVHLVSVPVAVIYGLRRSRSRRT